MEVLVRIKRTINLTKIMVTGILCVCCFMTTITVLAQENQSYAQALNMLDIFSGTENGFELSRTPTRSEALVMLIRLLGKEDEISTSDYPNPFLDTSWEKDYASYGYHQSLIKGIDDNNFGGGQDSTLKQYCTMLLRVLGYTELSGDFTYDNSISFAELVLGEDLAREGNFNRGMMARVSCYALNTRIKNNSMTLGQTLANDEVFTTQILTEAQKCWEQEPVYSSTTVLIYAIGSDLESQQGRLSKDLKEILNGEPKENCKVVLQTGGTLIYHNDFMTDGMAERFVINGKSIEKVGSVNTDATYPKTLSDFINWGVTQAPSQRYILVLWDHGYGITGGFGADELNERKTMSVSSISNAISDTNVYFDIIAFDACLMGTTEVAFALKENAKYMIASEDSTPACGLYYTTWINALERNPSISTRRLGRVILDSFTLHASIEANVPTTMSMMQLNRVNSLINQISQFKGDMQECIKNAQVLGVNEGIVDQFDLLSVMGDIPEIMATAQALAFEVRNSNSNKNYGGVAIYIPNQKQENVPKMQEELSRIGLDNTYLYFIFNGVKR